MTYTHVSLQYLTPVLPCVLSPVVVSSVSPPFPFCALSLCLQEEGVVSFCKVCAIGLVNTPSHHLLNDTKKHAPSPLCLPATPHAPTLLTPPPQPLQQHVPQSIRNLNYPSPLWTGCSSSPSPALRGQWLNPPDPSLFLACFFFFCPPLLYPWLI